MVSRRFSEPSAWIYNFRVSSWQVCCNEHIFIALIIVATAKNSAKVFGEYRISPVRALILDHVSGSGHSCIFAVSRARKDGSALLGRWRCSRAVAAFGIPEEARLVSF